MNVNKGANALSLDSVLEENNIPKVSYEGDSAVCFLEAEAFLNVIIEKESENADLNLNDFTDELFLPFANFFHNVQVGLLINNKMFEKGEYYFDEEAVAATSFFFDNFASEIKKVSVSDAISSLSKVFQRFVRKETLKKYGFKELEGELTADEIDLAKRFLSTVIKNGYESYEHYSA